MSIIEHNYAHTQVGFGGDLHVNFDPRGGAFDLSPRHEVRMAAKKVLVS